MDGADLIFGILAKLILFKGSPHTSTNTSHMTIVGTEIKRNFSRANFVPFRTIKLYLKSNLRAEYSFENLAGNILLFIPLGILAPLLFVKQRTFARILMLSLFVSLSLEVIQLVTALGILMWTISS